MRNPDYALYGFAKSKRERSAEDAETQFNQLSLQVAKAAVLSLLLLLCTLACCIFVVYCVCAWWWWRRRQVLVPFEASCLLDQCADKLSLRTCPRL